MLHHGHRVHSIDGRRPQKMIKISGEVTAEDMSWQGLWNNRSKMLSDTGNFPGNSANDFPTSVKFTLATTNNLA